MAGTLNVDTLKADSNLKLQIATANVAFIDSNGLNIVGGNLTLSGTTFATGGQVQTSGIADNAVTSAKIPTGVTLTSPVISGNTSFDSGTFFVDATNDKVGVGTTNPSFKMTVSSSTDNGIRVTDGTYSGTFNPTSLGGIAVGTDGAYSLHLCTNSTARGSFDSSGNFKFNSGYGSVATAYGCRAWVNINGGGTPSIRASGNMSSITDYGDSFYGLNFATAIVDGNYAWAFGGSNVNDGTGSNFTGFITTTSNQSASSLAIKGLNIYNGGANFTGDTAIATISIFR